MVEGINPITSTVLTSSLHPGIEMGISVNVNSVGNLATDYYPIITEADILLVTFSATAPGKSYTR